jgi:hypothetical protein
MYAGVSSDSTVGLTGLQDLTDRVTFLNTILRSKFSPKSMKFRGVKNVKFVKFENVKFVKFVKFDKNAVKYKVFGCQHKT